MTEMLNKEFSRKSFIKGGGALIVGFSALGAGLAGKAQAVESPYASNAPYDVAQIDSWFVVYPDNTASLLSGQVEFGQGTGTGLMMIAAEELDMDVSQLKFVQVDTNVVPSTGRTSASRGTNVAGQFVRAAAAATKQALLSLATAHLGVPTANLTVTSGVVSGGGKSVTYGELIGGRRFNVTMPAQYRLDNSRDLIGRAASSGLPAGAPGTKPTSQYKLLGTRVPRYDIPDKVTGKLPYVTHIRVPGMLHGRIVLPRGQSRYGSRPEIISVDENSIKHIPNVRVIRKGNLLGVVAPVEYHAIQAAAQLKVEWAEPPGLPGNGNFWKQMREQDAAGLMTSAYGSGDVATTGNVDAALASAAHVVSATYTFPYNAHAPIMPTCVVADVTPNGAVIFTGSQDIYDIRRWAAPLLRLPENRIRLRYAESGGNFGGGSLGRLDVPLVAALMSQLAGKPVRLQFMRWDEFGWTMNEPAQLSDLRGGVDASGKIVAMDAITSTTTSYTNVTNLADILIGAPFRTPVKAGPSLLHSSLIGSQYATPNQRLLVKHVPYIDSGYVRSGNVRGIFSVGAGFASEQLIDELAYAARMDPVEFRRKNITTKNALWNGVYDVSAIAPNRERLLSVLDAVAKAARWQPKVAASKLSDANVVTGRGVAMTIGIGSVDAYTAAIFDVEVNKKTGNVVAKHAYTAWDYGLVVSPDLVHNQANGMVMMATSRVLLEQTRFNKSRVTSSDFVSYPILRMKDHPRHTHVIITRPEITPGTGSEELTPVVVAAIANAFFDATGVRMRSAPLSPTRVRAALKAAGVG
jgi:CO/xanthine dehydrogenase Mo-binding subunit